mmetsp:Transcript_684/g.2426  ORF Transcript_684/g.2426 Transcript_684/m.2426 type:complete len:116 (-) Transcript_684:196-543(-)
MSVRVTALLFSGRQDPTWELTPEEAAELASRLAAAAQTATKTDDVNRLGYRGLSVRTDGSETAVVYGGVINRSGEGNVVDSGREVERFLAEGSVGKLPNDTSELIVSSVAVPAQL